MELLVEKMQKLLATSFAMYLKTHQFHWNVEGQDFHQYHDFFGKLYGELFGSVDTTAEQIRALGAKAKGSMTDFKEISAVRDQITSPSLQEMVAILNRDNETVISVLTEVHDEAEKLKAYGLLNYIEGRIDIHKKHGWMLRASMQTPSTNESVVEEETNTETVPQASEMIEEEVKTYIIDPKSFRE